MSTKLAGSTMFHATRGDRVPQILEQGLLQKYSNQDYDHDYVGWESSPGIYFFESFDNARRIGGQKFGSDVVVLAVDVSQIRIEPDPDFIPLTRENDLFQEYQNVEPNFDKRKEWQDHFIESWQDTTGSVRAWRTLEDVPPEFIQVASSAWSVHSNIFDPVQTELDQTVFDGIEPKQKHVRFVKRLYYRALAKELGLDGEQWADLYLTGSLTTYQWGETSDADHSVFPNYELIYNELGLDPDETRKRFYSLSVEHLDGTFLPGTTHPLQFFVVPYGRPLEEYFRPGLRSAWNYKTEEWVVPPEKERAKDIATQLPGLYWRTQLMVNKMNDLIDHDPDRARQLWAQVHKKRQLDQQAGFGDFSEGNIVYKGLLHAGVFDRLRNELGIKIVTKTAVIDPEDEYFSDMGTNPMRDYEYWRTFWIKPEEIFEKDGQHYVYVIPNPAEVQAGDPVTVKWESSQGRQQVDGWLRYVPDIDMLEEGWKRTPEDISSYSGIIQLDLDTMRPVVYAKTAQEEMEDVKYVPFDFEEYKKRRIPFYLMPDGTTEFGLPTQEHYQIEEWRWLMRNKAPAGSKLGEFQGHVYFSPEGGVKVDWPIDFDTLQPHQWITSQMRSNVYQRATEIWEEYNRTAKVAMPKESMPPASEAPRFLEQFNRVPRAKPMHGTEIVRGYDWEVNQEVIATLKALPGEWGLPAIDIEVIDPDDKMWWVRALGWFDDDPPTVYIHPFLTPEEASYTLWHEIQHAYQFVEDRMELDNYQPLSEDPTRYKEHDTEIDANLFADYMAQVPLVISAEPYYQEDWVPNELALDMGEWDEQEERWRLAPEQLRAQVDGQVRLFRTDKPMWQQTWRSVDDDDDLDFFAKAATKINDLWEDRVTTKVIYDVEGDRIILGTHATQTNLPGSKIVGEYKDNAVTLYEAEKQWINPTYFKRLWTFSYPDRPLEAVYFQRGDEKYKLEQLPKRARTTLYHVSPRRNRESILQRGLVPDADNMYRRGEPKYLWLWDDRRTALEGAKHGWGSSKENDIWAVDATGIHLMSDPHGPFPHAFATLDPIPAELLTLETTVESEPKFWMPEYRTHKVTMAERTGDPELDALIEEYLNQNQFDWWSCNGFDWATGEFMGDTWSRDELRDKSREQEGDYAPGDLSTLRNPDTAFGLCGDLARDFRVFLADHGINSRVLGGDPEAMYNDITEHEGGHAVTEVTMPSGTYMIDWTATQYGYTEFPMVQRLNEGQWEREWKTSSSVTYQEVDPYGDGDETLVMYLDGEEIGHLTYERMWGGEGRPIESGVPLYLNALWIDEEHRRKGLATMLVDELLRRKGITKDQISGDMDNTNWPEGGAFWDSYLPKRSAQEVMYHISLPQNRDSILTHGLNWELSDPETRLPQEDVDWPRGQYLFKSYPEGMAEEDNDIYEINVEGLEVEPDPFIPDYWDGDTFLVREPIEPERIRLVEMSAYGKALATNR